MAASAESSPDSPSPPLLSSDGHRSSPGRRKSVILTHASFNHVATAEEIEAEKKEGLKKLIESRDQKKRQTVLQKEEREKVSC